MKFEFCEVASGFLWTVSYTKQRVSLVEDNFTDNQFKIITLIESNNRITTNELAIEIGILQRKIKDNILKLKTSGILSRIGTPKSGYWKL
jgi:ATP-dependent DNA helicase RecG